MAEIFETYTCMGCSPGRGGYDLAAEADELVTRTRMETARFFGGTDPERVIFASNATDALNLAIQGLIGPGDHVVATRLEHNSVLRPLFHLKQRGWIDYDLVPFNRLGLIHPHDVAAAIRPDTKLVIICHASNVLGTVQPVADIGRICRERDVPLLVDTAQSAGLVEINVVASQASAVAFTGHKSLLGPAGIGGLVVAPDLNIATTRFGGTGIDSASLIHTEIFPHRLEAGTLNLPGIIGLSAGMKQVQKEGITQIHQRETALLERLHQGLTAMDNVVIYSPAPAENRVPVLLCNVMNLPASDVGAILDGDFDIAVRTGLHCAPLVHAELGTGRLGAVRFSPGFFNTKTHIDRALEAMALISKNR